MTLKAYFLGQNVGTVWSHIIASKVVCSAEANFPDESGAIRAKSKAAGRYEVNAHLPDVSELYEFREWNVMLF